MPQVDVDECARRVSLILMDVDGVLTDGQLAFLPGPEGLVEVKAFHVADGAGIALAHRAGLKTGLISMRASPSVRQRASELSMEEVHLGISEKRAALDEIVARTAIPPDRIAFVGDEVVDLPVMRRVGFPVAVANASEDVKPYAAYVTRARGGQGAVREVIELVLKAQGKWADVIREFLD